MTANLPDGCGRGTRNVVARSSETNDDKLPARSPIPPSSSRGAEEGPAATLRSIRPARPAPPRQAARSDDGVALASRGDVVGKARRRLMVVVESVVTGDAATGRAAPPVVEVAAMPAAGVGPTPRSHYGHARIMRRVLALNNPEH